MTGAQERTEKPTDKRLRKARRKGQVAKSRELVSVAVLVVGSIGVALSGKFMVRNFRELMQEILQQASRPAPAIVLDSAVFSSALNHFFLIIAPTVLAVTVAAVGLNLIQLKGFFFSFEAMRISLSNVNPLQGFKRFVSVRSLAELVKSLLKLAIVGYAVYTVIHAERHLLLSLVDQEVPAIMSVAGNLAFELMLRVAAVMLLVSLADYGYQKWQYRKDLMMTKQEIKEEYKESEGNPQIKSRIRSIQKSLARQRMLSQVHKATMVITNPTHYAVAMTYSPEMDAPTVVAKGVDFLARRIIKIARRQGIPVIQNPPLARALYKQVRLDETIPATLYRAVAKVLAYVFQQKRQSAK